MHNIHKAAIMSIFAVAIGASSIAYAESTGQYIDDATVTTKVKAAILADKELKATKVSVETNQGVVKLSGAVDTKSQETQAVRDANKINGVKSVNDLLQIGGPQDQ